MSKFEETRRELNDKLTELVDETTMTKDDAEEIGEIVRELIGVMRMDKQTELDDEWIFLGRLEPYVDDEIEEVGYNIFRYKREEDEDSPNN